MKILVVSSTAIPHMPWDEMAYGGIEILNYELAEELARRGHEVSLACQGDSKAPKGVNLIPLTKKEDNIASYFLYANQLDDFDAIHIGNHLPPIYRRKDLPYIAVRYDPQDVMYDSPRKNAVCPSRYASEKFSKMYNLQARIVNFGVDPNHYYVGEKGDRLVHLGAAIPQKGAFEAMGIARRLGMKLDIIAGNSPVKFSIDYGKVEGKDTIEVGSAQRVVDFATDLRGRHDGDTIRIHYNVSNPEKARILSEAKALIFPTWQKEAWTLSVIEAMMSGCPVVTYDAGCYPEIVEHGKTGFLCRNVLEMERYLKKVDTLSPDTVRMEAQQRFNLYDMVTSFEDIYKQVHEGVSW